MTNARSKREVAQAGSILDENAGSVLSKNQQGDIGYVPRNLGHYIKNVGDTDLVFLEIFKASRFQDISLSGWLTHTPAALVSAHFNVSAQDVAKFPNAVPDVTPL